MILTSPLPAATGTVCSVGRVSLNGSNRVGVVRIMSPCASSGGAGDGVGSAVSPVAAQILGRITQVSSGAVWVPYTSTRTCRIAGLGDAAAGDAAALGP